MEPQKQRLFDASKQYEVPIISGGEKRCTVRFPSDEEWIARAAKQRTIQHILGRGKTRAETLNAEQIDAELFGKIRVDRDGPEFDAAEAAAVIARLERAQILEVYRVGDGFKITMRVPGAVTEHILKMPKRGDVDAYAAASMSVTSGRRQQEIRVNLAPSGELYDAIHTSHSGYAGAVPIVHKDAAVFEVIAQLRALEDSLDGDEDPEA
jgi:hypothetical protein